MISIAAITTMQRILGGLLVVLTAAAYAGTSYAQTVKNDKPAAIIWINSWYGPNNSGVGISGRYGILGIGTTVFDFAGDTTSGLPIRPGAIGMSVDGYLAIDFSDWLTMYGNVGLIARLGTYRTSEDIARKYQKHGAYSVGGGFQISLASHLMLGIGYNGVVDVPEYDGGPTYNTIRSIVAQVGYRL